MRNCHLQRRLLLETLNSVDALNQAIIDEKSYYSHLKLKNMRRANNNNSGRVYNIFTTVRKEQSLHIEKSNFCKKCGNNFTKGELNVCPAKEIICNHCKNKGHFGRLCNLEGRRPVVHNVEDNINNQNCLYSPVDLQVNQ